MALAVAMERFLAKHLGGRVQTDVPKDVADHLASITVDPASVKVQKGPDAAVLAQAKTGTLPVADGTRVKPVVLEYGVQMEAAGQKMEMTLNRTIEEQKLESRELWRVTDAVSVAQGTMTSTFDVDKKSLEPVQYESTGMGNMKMSYTPKAITGEIGVGGKTMPVNQALEAPVYGSGAAFDIVLSGLPLADGYQTTFRVFEATMQKVRPMRLKVSKGEKVSVKAGPFETLVVEIEPLDGDDAGKATMHVTREAPHQLVKSSTKLPAAMGAGTLQTELISVSTATKVGSR